MSKHDDYPVFISSCQSLSETTTEVRLKLPKEGFDEAYVLIGDYTNYMLVYASYLPTLIEKLQAVMKEYNDARPPAEAPEISEG